MAIDETLVARWDWLGLNAAGDFENRINPPTGDLSPIGFTNTDSELVDTGKGQGLLLDGVKQLDGGVGTFLDFTIEDFSIEHWFQIIDFSHSNYILYKSTAFVGFTGYYIVIVAAGGVLFDSFESGGGDRTTSNNNVITPGSMHHLIVSKSGTRVRFYVNGKEVGYTGVGVHLPFDSAVAENLYVLSRDAATLNLDGYGACVRVRQREIGATEAYDKFLKGPWRT